MKTVAQPFYRRVRRGPLPPSIKPRATNPRRPLAAAGEADAPAIAGSAE
ncbi:MAG: hypothetical protein JWR47_2052 [Phenylobacterium sp.]|nr:hypothetical protein [Phenylobacterium sp.]